MVKFHDATLSVESALRGYGIRCRCRFAEHDASTAVMLRDATTYTSLVRVLVHDLLDEEAEIDNDDL